MTVKPVFPWRYRNVAQYISSEKRDDVDGEGGTNTYFRAGGGATNRKCAQ